MTQKCHVHPILTPTPKLIVAPILHSTLPVWLLQVASVAVSATFTVVQGPMTNIGWMFREDIFMAVCSCMVIAPEPCNSLLPRILLRLGACRQP